MILWFQKFFGRNGLVLSLYMLLVSFIWIVVMFVLPQIFMFDFSFRFNWTQIDPSKIGGPEDVYTLQHYSFYCLAVPIIRILSILSMSQCLRVLSWQRRL